MNPKFRHATVWLVVAGVVVPAVIYFTPRARHGRASAPLPAMPLDLLARDAAAVTGMPAAPAGPRLQSVQQTPTSLQLTVLLSNGESALETITFHPNQQYSPTAAELASQIGPGTRIFGVKFVSVPEGDTVRSTLHYVVPTDSLPPSLREHLYGATPTTTFIPLISTAQAQAGGAFWTGVDVAIQTKNAYDAATKMPPALKTLQKAYSAYKKIDAAVDKSADYTNWMNQLDAMEDCARNPTQTVTQNAYRDNPQHQQDTLNAIGQARSEASQATGARYVNQEASIAMSLPAAQPFAQPIVTDMTDAVAKWNDSALQQIGDGLVSDASKLVNCNLARPPARAAYNDGSIKYHMHRTHFYDYDEQDIVVDGPFSLNPAPGDTLTVSGEAAFKGHLSSTKSASLANSCEGRSALDGGGGYGTLWVGANPTVYKCSGTFSSGASESSFRCNFPKVDLENGGDYEVHAEGEESPWAVCELHLKPQQKP